MQRLNRKVSMYLNWKYRDEEQHFDGYHHTLSQKKREPPSSSHSSALFGVILRLFEKAMLIDLNGAGTGQID